MSKAKIDFTKYLVPVKLNNRDSYGFSGDESFNTTDLVWLPSEVEVLPISKLELSKKATDYAKTTANVLSSNNFIKSFSLVQEETDANYYLRSTDKNSRVNVVKDCDVSTEYFLSKRFGLAPCIALDVKAIEKDNLIKNGDVTITSKKLIDGTVKHYANVGEYPTSCVDNFLNSNLEYLYNFGKLMPELSATGRFYTAISNRNADTSSELIPEFEYKGNRYVRKYVRNEESLTTFKNGKNVYAGDFVWQMVEPISFEITNWDNLPKSINSKGKLVGADKTLNLWAENVLVGGIPFFTTNEKFTQAGIDYLPSIQSMPQHSWMWQNSLIRTFLNSAKTENLDGNPDFKTSVTWDFTNRGFLHETLNLSREKVSEYTIPDGEKYVTLNAFNGCVYLKKINIPSSIIEINVSAFNGLSDEVELFFKPSEKFARLYRTDNFGGKEFKYVYLTKDGETVIFSNSDNKPNCYKLECEAESIDNAVNFGYRHNFVKVKNMKEQGIIKFIPPNYTLKVFPHTQMENYFLNNNNQRWGKLVKTLGFDTLEDVQKENSLTDLLKLYYAIGGFSSNQGESEKAYDYIINYVAKLDKNTSPEKMGAEIHSRFSKLSIEGEYNKTFAQFFMKYYKDNPDFMNFRLMDKDGELLDSQDYLCAAHNRFDKILKAYPNRVVNGNEERSLLTPRFVAKHSNVFDYDGVDEENMVLAELAGRYGYTENQFLEMQVILSNAKLIKNDAVLKLNPSKSNNPIKYRLLEKDDPLGFVLGDITNCCQVLGGAGEDCVRDGYLNKNSGFIVFEESILDEYGKETGDTKIVGQAYTWYDPKTKTVCLDNIEIPTKVIKNLKSGEKHKVGTSMSDFIDSLKCCTRDILTSMNKTDNKVAFVTTGKSYNDLEEYLDNKFELDNNPKANNPDCGYSDARSAQYILNSYTAKTDAYIEKITENIKTCMDLINQNNME